MSMLDIHAAALEGVDESLHTFLLRYKATEPVVYGFVEGKEDPMFYRNLIERFLPDEWTVDLLRAGSKKKVKKTYDEMDWDRFDRNRIAFFVDLDLDFIFRPEVYPEGENVYLTDRYSIENSIVDERMFLRLLVEAYNIADLAIAEEDLLKSAFAEDLERFQSALRPVMAMILHWREQNATAHLNNLDLRLLFKFDQGRLVLVEGMDDVDARLDCAAGSIGAPRTSPEEQGTAQGRLDESGDCERLTRGKYLLWLLARALENVHREISRFSQTYRTPPKPKISVGPNNIMFHAAPRARCPASLRDFIENNFLNYIDRQAA